MRIATSALAVVAITAGVGVAGPLRHGGSATEASRNAINEAGVAAPDCSHVLSPTAGVARNDMREHSGHFVPGTPVVAVV